MSHRKKVLSGYKWTSLSTVVLAGTELVKTALYARFLEKEDLGIMALLIFITGFVTLFNDLGITVAILHKRRITRKQYSSLYWFNWMLSTVLFSALYLTAPLIATFYKSQDLATFIPIIAISLFFSALGNQFKTIEVKKLSFKSINVIDLWSSVFSLIVAVGMILLDFTLGAMVGAVLARLVFANTGYVIAARAWKYFNFYFKWSEIKPFLKIGLYQVGGQLINFFNKDVDVLIIGKFFAPGVLGGYSLARDLVRKPSSVISSIVNRVNAPSLAYFNSDLKLLKYHYLTLLRSISTVSLPIYLLIILTSDYIVFILFGNEYMNISILVKILAINAYMRLIAGSVGNLVVATGRTDLEFKWNVITFILIPILVFLGAMVSIEFVAVLVTLTIIILFVPFYYYLIKPMLPNCTFKEFIYSFFIPDTSFYNPKYYLEKIKNSRS